MLVWLSNRLASVAGVLASAILVAIVAFIVYEIVLRTTFHTSSFVLDEFVGYGVATMTFLSLAIALKDGAFIRVNLVIANLNEKWRRMFELAACAIGGSLFGFISFSFGRLVVRDFQRGTTSHTIAETPLWIPEGIMLIGLAILTLQFFALFVRYAKGEEINIQNSEL